VRNPRLLVWAAGTAGPNGLKDNIFPFHFPEANFNTNFKTNFYPMILFVQKIVK
jgi:hypothetical protein